MATVAGPSDALAAAPPAKTKLWDAEKRWSASVLVEGEPAEIYKVEHQPVSTTCYIEAVDGKKFTVSFAREAAAPTDQVVLLRIDGSNVDSMLFRKAKPDEGFFTGARISALEERPFVFAPIPLTDEADEAEVDEAILKDLGTIRLDVRRAKARKGGASSGDVYKDALKQHVIDEKSKKAKMGHSTAYGAPKAAPAQSARVNTDYLDNEPCYSFVFQYRSRAMLELERIVEPSAEAAALPAGADARESPSPASSSDADGGDLRAKIARLEAENARLRGPGGVKLKGSRKIKAEKEEVDFKVTEKDGKTVLDIFD
ncbi:hypothetical protein JCM8202v2_000402 [Rhodotorula sphaerocarpa]